MPAVELMLDIPADQFVDWYRGLVKTVVARTTTGATVEFPASVLQRFVTPGGVHGAFRLIYDENNKFVKIERADALPGTGQGLDLIG